MRNIIVGLLLICFVVNACHKEDDTPQPTTGSISGMVAPAGAADLVVAEYVGPGEPKNYSVVPDANTGVFKFSNLTPGTYYLAFAPNIKYRRRYEILEVIVATGKDTDMGVRTFTLNPISCKINGTSRAWETNANYSSPNFSTSGRSLIGKFQDNGSYYLTLSITLDAVTGPGTYVCKETSASSITYSMSSSGLMISRKWSSANAGGNATVVITAIDPVAKTISGSFTGTLTPSTGTTADSQVITDGDFIMNYQ